MPDASASTSRLADPFPFGVVLEAVVEAHRLLPPRAGAALAALRRWWRESVFAIAADGLRESFSAARRGRAGCPRLTASGPPSAGNLEASCRSSAPSTSFGLHPDLRLRPAEHDLHALVREREQLERLEREPDVLQRRHVEGAEEQELVRAVEGREHRPVEERRGVDDDQVVRLARDLEQPGQLAPRSRARRPPGAAARGGCRARACAGDVAAELLLVELAGRGDEVVDRLLRLEPEHDRGVAELEVEVEQERALAVVLRERGGEVRRGDRLAVPPFGENTVTTRGPPAVAAARRPGG